MSQHFHKIFIFCVCKTMCFYLKWCVKIKIQDENTKSQSKKTVCEIMNFVSIKLTKPKKTFLETQQNGTTF